MKQLISFFTFIALTCFSLPSSAQTTATNFTGVAKHATPAVVSIQVKAQNAGQSAYAGEDPLDFFNDDFFQRFFGSTPKRQGQGRAAPQQQHIGQASGFIVTPDGYILTNSHVIREADEITVFLNDGTEYSGTLVGDDKSTDLAVVKIHAEDLPYLELGDSDDLEVGQWVIAIGTPMGLQATLTAGVVSAKGRNNLDLANIEDFIQTDAAINRGNSGGPLLDMDAKVVGINTAIVANSGTGGHMGIGFAIPSNMAQRVMEQLITTGKVSRGFMGVALQTVDKDLALAFSLSKAEGALVSDVTKGSPAERSGLKQGDIIMKYDNKAVANIAALRNAIAMMEPGTSVNLTVIRDGETIQLPIELGTHPAMEVEVATKEGKLGIQVEKLTPELAQSLGYLGQNGVVVSKVEPASPAFLAGIKKGALVVGLNHQPLSSPDEFYAILEEVDPSQPTLLLIKQGEYTRYLSLRIE